MAKETRTILQPTYMKSFQCIGPACEDTCCKGWRVDLDKATYLKYKKVSNIEVKERIKEHVIRKHNNKSDVSYGQIKMVNNSCPFLNENLLCDIYKNLGEHYLSDTCKHYPRYAYQIDKQFERSATTSCPEIVRLALLNLKGISFEHLEEPFENKINVTSQLETEGHLYLQKSQRYFWDIRIFSLNLLQNRQYALGDRLTILGIVFKKIDALQIEKRMQELPALLGSLKSMIDQGQFSEDLNAIPVNTQIQMRLAKEMTDKKFIEGIASQRYIECFRETLLGLNQFDETPIEEVLEAYESGYNNYLKPYLDEKAYILENYLVNEFFRSMMPFGSFNTSWEAYTFLCILYGMVKLHLIGMAGYHKGMDDEKSLKLIQSFSKVVLHNNQYIQNVVKLVKDSGFDSLAHMAILVRN